MPGQQGLALEELLTFFLQHLLALRAVLGRQTLELDLHLPLFFFRARRGLRVLLFVAHLRLEDVAPQREQLVDQHWIIRTWLAAIHTLPNVLEPECLRMLLPPEVV